MRNRDELRGVYGDPLRTRITQAERMEAVPWLDLKECYFALENTCGLQITVRKALEKRVVRLEKLAGRVQA